MPRGFMGNFSDNYCARVNDAVDSANMIRRQCLSTDIYDDISDAWIISDDQCFNQFKTGVGTSSNIVLNPDDYDYFSREMRTINSNVAENVNMLLAQIEEMCNTIFVMPETGPKVMAYMSAIQTSLKEFVELGYATSDQTDSYVNEMVGQDATGVTSNSRAVRRSGAKMIVYTEDDIHNLIEENGFTFDTLIEVLNQNMKQKLEEADKLEDQARKQDSIALTAMKTVFYRDGIIFEFKQVPDYGARTAAEKQAKGKRALSKTRRDEAESLRLSVEALEKEKKESAKELEELLELIKNIDSKNSKKMSDINTKIRSYLSEVQKIFDKIDKDTKTAYTSKLKTQIIGIDNNLAQNDELNLNLMNRQENMCRALANGVPEMRINMEQFGFNGKTAYIMWEVENAINSKYPTNQAMADWEYARFMGGMGGYNERDSENYPESFDATSGDYYDTLDEYKDFLRELGISDRNIEYMTYHVRLQHQTVSKSDKYTKKSLKDSEKTDIKTYKKNLAKALGVSSDDLPEGFTENYIMQKRDEYAGNGDYAHQMITTAAILAQVEGVDKTDDLKTRYTGSDDLEDIMRNAGWKGDINGIGFAWYVNLFGGVDDVSPNMLNDDYKSDLDAANITYYMKKHGLSLSEATAKYYTEIDKGSKTRAGVFKEHTPIEEVKKNVDNYDENETAKKFVASLDADSNEFFG
jgi:hypothetical protein